MRLGPLFWSALFAVGGLFELTTWATGHNDSTLSAQVWAIVGWAPAWADALGLAAFGAAASVLAVHFWGKR
ncbi:MAG TPA: hypothetical protein VFB20_10735 [Burkholderiales bacterium]|nr:hypothetical protein [Burkholderiales bacterium]